MENTVAPADPGIFMGGGGGGRKLMCPHAHHERKAQSPLRPESGPLKGPGRSRFFMLSHAK